MKKPHHPELWAIADRLKTFSETTRAIEKAGIWLQPEDGETLEALGWELHTFACRLRALLWRMERVALSHTLQKEHLP